MFARKPIDVVEYELARDLAEEAWEEYVIMVGSPDAKNEKLEQCKRLQTTAWKLSEQLNCPHENVDRIGSDVFVGGDWYLREHEICLDCEKEGVFPIECDVEMMDIP